jgi:hypothetical protein
MRNSKPPTSFLWHSHTTYAILLWVTHRRKNMFIPPFNSHFSNRLFLFLLAVALFASILARPRTHPSFLNSITSSFSLPSNESNQ